MDFGIPKGGPIKKKLAPIIKVPENNNFLYAFVILATLIAIGHNII